MPPILLAGRRLALAFALFGAGLAATPGAVAQPAGRPATYVVRAGDTLFRIARTFGTTAEELRRLNGLRDNNIRVGQTLRLGNLQPVQPRPPAGADGAPPTRPARATPRGPQAITHVVQSGETLAAIARRYDTSPDVLRRLNGIVGERISPGQQLVVLRGRPGTAPAPTSTPRPPLAEASDGEPDAPPRPTAPALPTRASAPTASAEVGPWRIDRTTVPADMVHFVEPGETLLAVAARYGFASDDLVAANPGLTTAPLEPGTLLVLPAPVDPAAASGPALPDPDTTGLALVYPRAMEGRRTASGAPYDPAALTASHRTLPFGTILLVTNPASGRSTFVRVTDRGPISGAYLIELSAAAAAALELDPNNARRVELRRLP